MKNTHWRAFLRFLNSKRSNKIFTRNELTIWLTNRNRRCKRELSSNTLNLYRLLLTHSGYLKVIEPGVYRKLRKVPENMTYTQAEVASYGPRKDFCTAADVLLSIFPNLPIRGQNESKNRQSIDNN